MSTNGATEITFRVSAATGCLRWRVLLHRLLLLAAVAFPLLARGREVQGDSISIRFQCGNRQIVVSGGQWTAEYDQKYMDEDGGHGKIHRALIAAGEIEHGYEASGYRLVPRLQPVNGYPVGENDPTLRLDCFGLTFYPVLRFPCSVNAEVGYPVIRLLGTEIRRSVQVGDVAVWFKPNGGPCHVARVMDLSTFLRNPIVLSKDHHERIYLGEATSYPRSKGWETVKYYRLPWDLVKATRLVDSPRDHEEGGFQKGDASSVNPRFEPNEVRQGFEDASCACINAELRPKDGLADNCSRSWQIRRYSDRQEIATLLTEAGKRHKEAQDGFRITQRWGLQDGTAKLEDRGSQHDEVTALGAYSYQYRGGPDKSLSAATTWGGLWIYRDLFVIEYGGYEDSFSFPCGDECRSVLQRSQALIDRRFPKLPLLVAGRWKSTDPKSPYLLQLRQNGSQVWGDYEIEGAAEQNKIQGQVAGELSAGKVELYWVQLRNWRSGTTSLSLSDQGNALAGPWEYDPFGFDSQRKGGGQWGFRRIVP